MKILDNIAAYLASCCEYSATASAKGPVADRILTIPGLASTLVEAKRRPTVQIERDPIRGQVVGAPA